MPKLKFSRGDMQALCDRLDARVWSPLAIEMPMLQRDLREAAALLRWFAQWEVLPGSPYPIDIDIFNGTI